MKKILAIVLMMAVLTCPAFASGETAAQADTAAAVNQAECNHAFSVDVTKEATCTEKGLLTYTCSLCGLTYTVETLPTGEHDYVASVKEPTCTEEGATTYTCSMCGDSYSEVIPAAGHTPSAAVASCTENVVCTTCGELLEAATGHAYTYQYDATTDEDGNYVTYGTWACDNCGDVLEATEGNAVYYYGLQANTEASGEASGEASEEVVELADPNNGVWATVETIAVVVLIVECAVLMLSFGKKKIAQ
jgi:rubredoxin